MATYNELYGLWSNADLRNKINVACWVAAQGIIVEDAATPNHANRLLWAKSVFNGPEAAASGMMAPVLAANKTLTVAQILAASDSAVQSAVAAAVNVFATGS